MSVADRKKRLGDFIAELATDPAKLAAYQGDPAAVMQAAGLDDEQQAILRKGSFSVICDYLGGGGPRPLEAAPAGGGSGG